MVGDKEELARFIREYENRPDRPSVPMEERHARIRAECERRGIDADEVLAECERRGYWEPFDCGEADNEDVRPEPRGGNPYAGLDKKDLRAKLKFIQGDCKTHDTAVAMLRRVFTFIENSRIGQNASADPPGLRFSPRARARLWVARMVNEEFALSPDVPRLADQLLLDAVVCGVSRDEISRAIGITKKQLRTRIAKTRKAIEKVEKKLDVPVGSLIRRPT